MKYTWGIAVLLALFTLPQHANAASELVNAEVCTLEAFVAYGTAREAVKGKRRAYWKMQPETSDFQNSFLDELYKRVDEQGFKDYMLFGSEKLIQCLSNDPTNKVPEPSTIASCFAEIDVVMYARQYKAGGGGLAGTKKYARGYLKDPRVYPQSLLDRVIPLAFVADDSDKLFDLREKLLRECMLPKFPS